MCKTHHIAVEQAFAAKHASADHLWPFADMMLLLLLSGLQWGWQEGRGSTGHGAAVPGES